MLSKSAADFEFPDAMWAWFPFFAAAAVLYFPVIFGLKQIMMNHEAFDLKDKSPVNLVFWWNQLQGVFATVVRVAFASGLQILHATTKSMRLSRWVLAP